MRNDIVHYLLSFVAYHAAEVATDSKGEYEALHNWAKLAYGVSELAKSFEGDGVATNQMKRKVGRFLKSHWELGGDWEFDALYDVYHGNPFDSDAVNTRGAEFDRFYKERFHREPPDPLRP